MRTDNDKEVKLDLRICIYPHTWYTDMLNPVMTTTTIGSRRITQINSIRSDIINICESINMDAILSKQRTNSIIRTSESHQDAS